jgi:hypothetical protein
LGYILGASGHPRSSAYFSDAVKNAKASRHFFLSRNDFFSFVAVHIGQKRSGLTSENFRSLLQVDSEGIKEATEVDWLPKPRFCAHG